MSVCSTCDDTHRMVLEDHPVPCTHCPLPCRDCASNGGRGAYCSRTPCPCKCHLRSDPPPPTHEAGERIRARELITRIRATLEGVAIAVNDEGSAPGFDAAQAITEAATLLAMAIAKIDAYHRAARDRR